MNATTIITAILRLFTGIGIFVVACSMVGDGFRRLSGERVKNMFAKIGDNKFTGLCVGTLTTAAVQSSGAVTVTVIGLVNAGIISLSQSAVLIYGANIGTTVTGQLVALGVSGGDGVSPAVILSALTGVGALILSFSKSDKTKTTGIILAGFGMIFAALHIMSDATHIFAKSAAAKELIASFDNPILLVLVGAAITAVVQSSSVVTSVAISMTGAALIPLGQCVYITLGANIGACVISLIAGVPQGGNAERVALIHLLFNVGGALLFLCAGLIIRRFGVDYGDILYRIFPHSPQLALASFHTFFNIATAVAALPLTSSLIKLTRKLVPDTVAERAENVAL